MSTVTKDASWMKAVRIYEQEVAAAQAARKAPVNEFGIALAILAKYYKVCLYALKWAIAELDFATYGIPLPKKGGCAYEGKCRFNHEFDYELVWAIRNEAMALKKNTTPEQEAERATAKEISYKLEKAAKAAELEELDDAIDACEQEEIDHMEKLDKAPITPAEADENRVEDEFQQMLDETAAEAARKIIAMEDAYLEAFNYLTYTQVAYSAACAAAAASELSAGPLSRNENADWREMC